MADTSNLLSHFYIKLNGADASEELMLQVLSLKVETSLHLPSVATIVLEDSTLKWIDDERLAPGKSVEISTKGNGASKKLFDGEIVELEPEFGAGTQRLVVRAFDRLHRLTRGRYVRSFVNVSDSDLVGRIASDAGLDPRARPTNHVYDYVLQANETNLAFLQKRAALFGYLLFVDGRTLHFEPVKSGPPTATVQWGNGLIEFFPRMTTLEQVSSVTVRGWDWQAKQEIVGQVQNGQTSPKVGQSKKGGELVKSGFSMEAPYLITHRLIQDQGLADRLAQAVADRHDSRFIEADGLCTGNPSIVAGATINITSVGDRFSGSYFVTNAVHTFDPAEHYKTRFSVSGLNPTTLLSLIVAAEEQPVPAHVAIGIVTNNSDPDGFGRVKVKFPWLSSDHESDWVRIAVPGGGDKRGMQFLPEVNDEVLVAFELGDIQSPYVIGGLWNGRDKPPLPNNEATKSGQVVKRVIYSRTGHKIIIDDDPSGGGITIQDKSDNVIQLDTRTNKLTVNVAGNIEMTAKGDIKMKASGRVEIESNANVRVQAASTVDVKGSMINLN
jgi:uncharacterized protein involved in type VI secretion and phage assembly